MENLKKYRCMLEVFIDVESESEEGAIRDATRELIKDLEDPDSKSTFIVWEENEVTVP